MKKIRKKYLLATCAVIVAALGMVCAYNLGHRNQTPTELAKTALLATVENPETIKILAMSKPDSIFGRDYVNDKERMAIALSMMKINETVSKATDGFENLDLEDPALKELMERQVSAMSALRSIMAFAPSEGKQMPFNGWKVKIEYEAMNDNGSPYRSEYWFIIDKKSRCVINSFEIPVV